MWEKVYAISKNQVSKAFPINYEFTTQVLIISATSGSANPNWKRAGYLQPIFLLPEIGQVKGQSKSLIIGTQIINFVDLQLPYFLEFQFLSWFLDIDLSIWANFELSPIELDVRLKTLQDLVIDNKQNLALVQQQLDRIEDQLNATTGQ